MRDNLGTPLASFRKVALKAMCNVLKGHDPPVMDTRYVSGAPAAMAIAVLLVIPSAAGWAAKLTLAKDGQPTATIVLAGALTLDDAQGLTRLGKLTLEPLEEAAGTPARVDGQAFRRGLIGRWTFDDGPGQFAADSSGNGLHGRLAPGAEWVPGVHGLALRLPGWQAVTVGNQPLTNLTGPLTLMAWVKPTGDGWYPAIVGKGYEASGAYSLHIRRDWSLWFELDDPDGKRWFHNPTDLTLEPGVWNHVAATYDGRTMRVYINGHEVGQGREGPVANRQTSEPLRIGWLGSYGFFEGEVDEVALYSRALSAEEVRAEYLAGVASLGQ